MATRTQKATMKKKAAAPKSEKAKAPRAAKSETPKADTARPTTEPSSKRPSKQGTAAPSRFEWTPGTEPAPNAKPSLGERFWRRIGLGAQAHEERAHLHHAEREAAIERQVQADRAAQEEAREAARAARREHAVAERKASQKSAREMARIAREEDARLKREAVEARARAAEEKAAMRRDAAKAKREAAREARLQAEAQAKLDAEDKEAQAKQAAEGKAAHRRELAAARREKAKQAAADAKRTAEEKAEQRRLARQTKLDQAEREKELAVLEQEAVARRQASKVHVGLREKPVTTGDEGQQDEEEAEERDATPAPMNGHRAAASSQAASPVDVQADNVADELRRLRSKPVTIDADDAPVPTLPVGRRASRADEPKQVLRLDPAPPARIPEMAAPRGLSIPEHYLLLAVEGVWDERQEKANPGGFGGGLTGALVLELVLQDKVRVQRDRFQVTDVQVDDAAGAVAAKLAQWPSLPALQAMGQLAKELPTLLPAYKDRMAARGLIEHRAWRHLGMFYRSQTALLDEDAQERMRNKLARAIAGGGRPDAPTILSLGLLEASGLFGLVVPEGAQAYNRKRLNGLLAGKDVMGYKVDDELKGMQEMAVRTVLDNVRVMTVRG